MHYPRCLGFLLALAVGFTLPLPAAHGAPRYEIIADYDHGTHRISGAELIFFDNTSNVALTEVDLFLYPNIFLQKEPFTQKNLIERAYPNKFNPGQMTLATVQDKEGHDLIYQYDKSFALVHIFLAAPIPPGERGRLRVLFTTLIPEKWGSFGYFRQVTYLQGGWHPFLVPLSRNGWDSEASLMKSNFEILLTLDRNLAVMSSGTSRVAERGKTLKTLLLEEERVPFFTLAIERGYRKSVLLRGGMELIYNHLPRDRLYADRLLKVAEEVVDFFSQRYGKLDLKSIQMVEVYLYEDLASSGEGVVFVGSHLFKIFPYLRRYHEASVAQAILLQLWKRKLSWEEEWVAEGMAGRDLETYLSIKYGGEESLALILKPLGFFPLIDQIIYSKDLPLRQVFFKESEIPPFYEDIRLFWVHRPPGGEILTKLKNLVGQETLNQIIKSYLLRIQEGKHPLFISVSQEVSQEYLEAFYAQWLKNNPAIDYAVERVERTRVESNYQTTIVLSKKGAGVEPVKIRVVEANGNEMTLVWGGQGEHQEETLITPAPITVVEVDPDGEINDPNRFNNRYPHAWKILLNNIGVGYDFQTHRIDYSIEFGFQRLYDDKNLIVTRFNHDEIGTEGVLSFTHVFLNHEGISASIGSVRPEFNHIQQQTSGVVGVVYQFSYPQVPLTTEFIQRLTGTVPPINISFSYLQQFTGGDYDFSVQLNADLRQVFAFSNYHAIATRFFLGESTGGLFNQNRYFLGGEGGMRGFTPLVLGGNNISLFSVEYRFPLVYETDFDILSLVLTRTIQGAIFSDAGMVTNSHNTFQFAKYVADGGVSVRLFLDFFGIFPALARFDVAYPVGSPVRSERVPHFYLTAGQPF